MILYRLMYIATYHINSYTCGLFLFQEGTTPIMLAMVASQSDVADLLKNKYGQKEPFPEAVSS